MLQLPIIFVTRINHNNTLITDKNFHFHFIFHQLTSHSRHPTFPNHQTTLQGRQESQPKIITEKMNKLIMHRAAFGRLSRYQNAETTYFQLWDSESMIG